MNKLGLIITMILASVGFAYAQSNGFEDILSQNKYLNEISAEYEVLDGKKSELEEITHELTQKQNRLKHLESLSDEELVEDLITQYDKEEESVALDDVPIEYIVEIESFKFQISNNDLSYQLLITKDSSESTAKLTVTNKTTKHKVIYTDILNQIGSFGDFTNEESVLIKPLNLEFQPKTENNEEYKKELICMLDAIRNKQNKTEENITAKTDSLYNVKILLESKQAKQDYLLIQYLLPSAGAINLEEIYLNNILLEDIKTIDEFITRIKTPKELENAFKKLKINYQYTPYGEISKTELIKFQDNPQSVLDIRKGNCEEMALLAYIGITNKGYYAYVADFKDNYKKFGHSVLVFKDKGRWDVFSNGRIYDTNKETRLGAVLTIAEKYGYKLDKTFRYDILDIDKELPQNWKGLPGNKIIELKKQAEIKHMKFLN